MMYDSQVSLSRFNLSARDYPDHTNTSHHHVIES